MKYWIVTACLLLAACSSKKLKYDKDDEIEVKATVGTATEIGLNTDEEPIIQDERARGG